MKHPPTRPPSAIAFCAGTAAITLPPPEIATIRTLCKTTRLTADTLSHLLHALNIRNSDFSHALFTLSNITAQDTIPLSNFLTVYAVLRRLAYSHPDTARDAAQEAVWLAFCSAAGGTHAPTVSWPAWFQFQSKLGECLGGVQSLPCRDSVDAMRRAWRKARPPFRDALTFEKLVQVLRVYDAGLVKSLRAIGFLLATKVIDAGDGFVEKPVWDGDQDDVCFGQFLTYAIGEAIGARDACPSDSGNGNSGEELERHTYQPTHSLLNKSDREPSTVAKTRPRVTFGLPASDVTGQSSDDKSPTSVLPSAPKTTEMVRRSARKSDKTPFHIDYSSLQLGERIGSGAYGDVYRGSFLMSPVAVKMFHVNLHAKPNDDQDPSQLNRMSTMSALQRFASVNSLAKYRNFVREVEMMSVVRHPNLVLYMGACGDPVTPLCIVSELFTGGSLFEFLHGSEEFRPSVALAINFGLNIARGMFYLHSSQPSIVHRDLKSRNVLLSGRKSEHDGTPHVVICDFGLCQLFGEEGQSSNQTGTASYMSPEVINGKKYEAADDVYSYGILLHEILTGCVPYEGMRAMQVLFQVANDGLRPSFEERDVPKQVRDLVEECWHAERGQRPGFDEIIERLNEIEAGFASTVVEPC